MLDTNLAAPATLKYPAVVEVLPGHDPDHGLRCRLYHRDGWCDAWTWLPLDATAPFGLQWGVVTTMEIGQHPEDILMLSLDEGAEPPLSELLPEHLCPIPGVLRQTTRLIDSLRSTPLRRFMTRVLVNPESFQGYWTSPASRRDHHAYPGGLAEHSLEVATMVATAKGLPEEDRELGIVFALLHDFGKIWCYDPLACRRIDSREHEAHGLAELEFDLLYLNRQNPKLGGLLTELLGGPRARRDGKYPLAIGRIVRSFDQMSCEKTRKPDADAVWDIPL